MQTIQLSRNLLKLTENVIFLIVRINGLFVAAVSRCIEYSHILGIHSSAERKHLKHHVYLPHNMQLLKIHEATIHYSVSEWQNLH